MMKLNYKLSGEVFLKLILVADFAFGSMIAKRFQSSCHLLATLVFLSGAGPMSRLWLLLILVPALEELGLAALSASGPGRLTVL